MSPLEYSSVLDYHATCPTLSTSRLRIAVYRMVRRWMIVCAANQLAEHFIGPFPLAHEWIRTFLAKENPPPLPLMASIVWAVRVLPRPSPMSEKLHLTLSSLLHTLDSPVQVFHTGRPGVSPRATLPTENEPRCPSRVKRHTLMLRR